jgi:nucleotide-binding universal stress UspA family protein
MAATASGAGERWVGLAMDFSEGSRAALRWAADNLLRAGDQLLLLHVIKEPDYEQSEAILWEATGSREYSASPSLPPTLALSHCAESGSSSSH